MAVVCLMQWGLTRVTGIKLPFRNLSYRPGRPLGIVILVVSLVGSETEFLLLRHGLLAIVIGVLGVAAEMALLQAALRMTRRELRAGGGAA